MEGILFYWISWMFWIIVIFFMKRSSKERFFLAISLLLLIISSTITIEIFDLSFSGSSLFLNFTVIFILTKYERKIIYSIFGYAFVITLAFACFQIYELFDPVWLKFSRLLMMSCLLAVLSIILHAKNLTRFFILLIGSIQGDFLYALVIKKFSFPYTIGSLGFLDIVTLSAVYLFVWNGIEKLVGLYTKYDNQSQKQKLL